MNSSVAKKPLAREGLRELAGTPPRRLHCTQRGAEAPGVATLQRRREARRPALEKRRGRHLASIRQGLGPGTGQGAQVLQGSIAEPAIRLHREGDDLPGSPEVRVAPLLLGLCLPVDCASAASSSTEASRVPRHTVVYRHIHEGPRHPRRADLEVKHSLLKLNLQPATAPATRCIGVGPSDAANVAAGAVGPPAIPLRDVDLGAHCMATLCVDASQLPLHVFTASFQTAPSGAAVTVMAQRTKGLATPVARVDARAGDIVTGSVHWNHRLAKKHASRSDVIHVIQFLPLVARGSPLPSRSEWPRAGA